MTRPAHIIWDWNGTLLNDVAAGLNAVNALLQARALPATTLDAYRRDFRFPVRDYYTALGFPPDLPPGEWQDLAAEYHLCFAADTSAALFPDTLPALRQCAVAGIPQSVLSALHHPLLIQTLALHNLTPFFAHVIGVDNLDGASKLDQGRQLLSLLPHAPADILLIGDTLHDFDVARTLGVRPALIARGHQSAERLAASGAPVFHSLTHALDTLL